MIVADSLHREKFIKVWSFQVKQVSIVTLEITVDNSFKYIGVSSTTLTVFVFALAVLSQLQDVICGFMTLVWRPQTCEQVSHANLPSTLSTVKAKTVVASAKKIIADIFC